MKHITNCYRYLPLSKLVASVEKKKLDKLLQLIRNQANKNIIIIYLTAIGL
jgi:hypothetical protein